MRTGFEKTAGASAAHQKKINPQRFQWEQAHPDKVARYRKKKNARRRRWRAEARRATR